MSFASFPIETLDLPNNFREAALKGIHTSISPLSRANIILSVHSEPDDVHHPLITNTKTDRAAEMQNPIRARPRESRLASACSAACHGGRFI